MNPSECKSVAIKSRISVTLEKKIEVIHRMGDGDTRPDVCRSAKLPLLTVSTIMRNKDETEVCATCCDSKRDAGELRQK